MKLFRILALHCTILVLAAGSLVGEYVTTWRFGGASWAYFPARWKATDADIENKPRPEGSSEEDLNKLLAVAGRWGFWRQTFWWSSVGVCVLSLLLTLLSRNRLCSAFFALTAVLTFLSWQLRGVVF